MISSIGMQTLKVFVKKSKIAGVTLFAPFTRLRWVKIPHEKLIAVRIRFQSDRTLIELDVWCHSGSR